MVWGGGGLFCGGGGGGGVLCCVWVWVLGGFLWVLGVVGGGGRVVGGGKVHPTPPSRPAGWGKRPLTEKRLAARPLRPQVNTRSRPERTSSVRRGGGKPPKIRERKHDNRK